jgi:acetolactate synthase-1/3 small subunit
MIKTLAHERHTLSVLVDNEAGVLARIVGLFSARGYNIESLTVADVSENHQVSRITIVTSGPPKMIDQIMAQLDRLVVVHQVSDLTELGPHVEREMALLKVRGTGEKRLEAMRLADVYRARVVDATIESFVFEITGSTDKVDTFITLMRELGLIEVARGGVVAISRGKDIA